MNPSSSTRFTAWATKIVNGPAADVAVGGDAFAAGSEQLVDRQAGASARQIPQHPVDGVEQPPAGVHESLGHPEPLPDVFPVKGIHAYEHVGIPCQKRFSLPFQFSGIETCGIVGVRIQVSIRHEPEHQAIRWLGLFPGERKSLGIDGTEALVVGKQAGDTRRHGSNASSGPTALLPRRGFALQQVTLNISNLHRASDLNQFRGVLVDGTHVDLHTQPRRSGNLDVPIAYLQRILDERRRGCVVGHLQKGRIPDGTCEMQMGETVAYP